MGPNKAFVFFLLASLSLIESAPANHATVSVFQERTEDGSLRATIETSDEKHNLVLKKVAEPAMRMQEITGIVNGSVILANITTSGEFVYYEDEESGAMMYLNSEDKLEGFLSDTQFLQYQGNEHFLTDVAGEKENCGTKGFEFDVNLDMVELKESEINLRQSTVFIVETGVLIDSALANRLGSDSSVLNYLSFFFKIVDKRYRTVSGATFRILVPDVYISRSYNIDTNFEEFIQGNFIHQEQSIQKLGSFSNALSGTFDVLQLLTGRDLAIVEGNAIQSGTTGIAYTRGACVPGYKVGISEDNAFWGGVRTCAHEIAHNLGSYHDGDGTSSSCPFRDGYIMSYYRYNYKTTRFSPCSSAAMRAYALTNQGSCLRTVRSGSFIQYPNTEPGQYYSLTQQCQMRTRVSNAVYNNRVSSNTHCYQLNCIVNDGSQTYYWRDLYPALEGSICSSNGGVCSHGFCV